MAEFGSVEAAYAEMRKDHFARLVQRYGHTAIAPKRYTAASFLASTLGRLGRTGHLLVRWGLATGRWAYSSEISWWALAPEPSWDDQASWADLGRGMDYVPGDNEK